MAQVSDPSSNIQQAIGSLQSRNPRQNQQVEGKEAAEKGRSNRLDQQKESNEAQQVRQTEDRVLISRETQEPNRETRVDQGKRNVDNLRPPTEQRVNERGAAQRLNDRNEVNSLETRNNEGGVQQTQPEDSPGNTGQEVNAERNRTVSREEAEIRDQIRKEAADRKSPEIQLREFQNKDEIRIEPKNVAKSVEEVEGQRERAETARESVFETPSQRIIQEEAPAGGTERVRSAENNARADQTGSDRQPPSPTSVQTETGQNIDDLI